jgi:hypothetical protein
VKNDKRDATDLVILFRMGRPAEGWVDPPPLRQLRELIRRAPFADVARRFQLNVTAVVRFPLNLVLYDARFDVQYQEGGGLNYRCRGSLRRSR